MNETAQRGFAIMDTTREMINKNEIFTGLNNLARGFQDIIETSTPQDWIDFSQKDFLSHSLVNVIHQCPFTRHSFVKPRNYAGDADLIDYMYGYRKPSEDTTETGKKIFEWTWNQTTAQSVRARKEIIAGMIDEIAEDEINIRSLSIACGHLREEEVASQRLFCDEPGNVIYLEINKK